VDNTTLDDEEANVGRERGNVEEVELVGGLQV
jgi:hypothetical protein